MNFPQVFDTWDSGSHGLVASLSRSLVLGSSSPRIGLLVAFWATFQARALRRNWARACFVVALSCVRIREHRDLVCARDRFQSRHQFISSVVFECAHQFSGVWALRPGGAVGVAAEGESRGAIARFEELCLLV